MGTVQKRGRAAERMVAAYLEMVGFELIDRNARVAGVEVDLLALDGETRVLIEVKMRARTDFGGAAAALGGRQRGRLRRAARAVSEGHPVRVDVVAVEPDDDGARIDHYRNALTD